MAFTHEHAWKLPETPARVFNALTNANQLGEWFAEHAAVGDAVGSDYRFWGRHTLGTANAALASQQITQWEDEHLLGFSWTIGEVPSEVTIELAHDIGYADAGAGGASADASGDAGADAGCRFVLHHAIRGELAYERPQELIDDHWRLAIGNLLTYLAEEDVVWLPDYAASAPVLSRQVMIDAPRENVFAALITPRLVAKWLGAKAPVIEPKKGGAYRLGWEYEIAGRQVVGGPTQILDLIPNERLVLDWPDWRGDPAVPLQQIAFALESSGDATRVTLEHSGFVRAADVSDYPFGWNWFLQQLRVVATSPV